MGGFEPRWLLVAMAGFCLAALSGCSTQAAKQALNKVPEQDNYTNLSKSEGLESDRRAKNVEPVADDMDPEKAVDILVDHLQRKERAYSIPAEDELRVWATKQGVPEIIVAKVRGLLKHPRIEVRAPALRLTMAYGKKESLGDLIEVLADEDYGMRNTAFQAVKARAGRDLGYASSGGALARAKAIESWRRWWQDEQRAVSTAQVPLATLDDRAPPQLVKPERTEAQANAGDGQVPVSGAPVEPLPKPKSPTP